MLTVTILGYLASLGHFLIAAVEIVDKPKSGISAAELFVTDLPFLPLNKHGGWGGRSGGYSVVDISGPRPNTTVHVVLGAVHWFIVMCSTIS